VPERPGLQPTEVSDFVLAELARGPELAMQKGYLARVLSVGQEGVVDEGVHPLEVFVDGTRDGVAVTLEFDDAEAIRPALYVRRDGHLQEVLLPPHPLRRYDGPEYEVEVAAALKPLLGL
jgi:hypothetical protein